MVHPIIETKWQLDKIRELTNQLDTVLDEAEYQANQAEEAIEQASKWEEAKEEAISLVRQAMRELDELDYDGTEPETNRGIDRAYDKLREVVKELEK